MPSPSTSSPSQTRSKSLSRASSFLLQRSSLSPPTPVRKESRRLPSLSTSFSPNDPEDSRQGINQRSTTSPRPTSRRSTNSIWTRSPLSRSDSWTKNEEDIELHEGVTQPGSPATIGARGLSERDGASDEASAAIEEEVSQRKQLHRRASRSSSLFGSLRALRMSEMSSDYRPVTPLSRTPSGRSPSFSWNDWTGKGLSDIGGNRNVLHHGEAQTETGMFWKKKQYFVLTDTHLVRFKSQSKAAEIFPSIQSTLYSGKTKMARHSSSNSATSIPDFDLTRCDSVGESATGTRLEQIVAVHRPDEPGRQFSSLEVSCMDADASVGSSFIMQFGDEEDRDLWCRSIRWAANRARLRDPDPIPAKLSEYAARAVEMEQDYNISNFRIYKVTKRTTPRSSSRSSADDISYANSAVCFLVVGTHKVHLIPLPKPTARFSSPSIANRHDGESFGILTLTGVSTSVKDDNFSLEFRLPFERRKVIRLTSLASTDIAVQLRHRENFLRPQWTSRPYNFAVPSLVDDNYLPDEDAQVEDHDCFDRTLIAYCVAYALDPSKIRYTINYSVEDAPRFELLEPAHSRSRNYSSLELLAIMRSLRYNETFGSLSFRGIKLDVLRHLRDRHGVEHVCTVSKCGTAVMLDVKEQQQASVLVQEVRALAITSKHLRRLDFSYCIGPHQTQVGADATPPLLSCELVEALFPLCKHQTADIDWLALNGIELGETDLEYLISIAAEKDCHFRAIEVSRCGLNDRGMTLLLDALGVQGNTLEALSISHNPFCLVPSILSRQFDQFGYLRMLDLSNLTCTSSFEPLIPLETLCEWRLEDLRLGGVALNQRTVQALCGYLGHRQSEILRELILCDCSLTGRDVADIMLSMTRDSPSARFLHLDVSENCLQQHHDSMTNAIARSLTPTHLSMRSIEYTVEQSYRDLLRALLTNRSIRYLDVAKVSLPAEADEETCKALKEFLSSNDTLEDLDISGENSRLEISNFGVGISQALSGLKHNRGLQTLRIQYQNLGIQGASALADVLEGNKTLRQLHCDYNAITLSGFTDLVNALASNTKLLYLPTLEEGRDAALRQTKKQLRIARTKADGSAMAAPSSSLSRMLSVRGKLSGFPATSPIKAPSKVPAVSRWTEQDVRAALRLINEGWEIQAKRLQQFLNRNWNIYQGIPREDVSQGEEQHPTGALRSISDPVQKNSRTNSTADEKVKKEDQDSTSQALQLTSSGPSPTSEKSIAPSTTDHNATVALLEDFSSKCMPSLDGRDVDNHSARETWDDKSTGLDEALGLTALPPLCASGYE